MAKMVTDESRPGVARPLHSSPQAAVAGRRPVAVWKGDIAAAQAMVADGKASWRRSEPLRPLQEAVEGGHSQQEF